MKKIVLFLFSIVALSACEGDRGPQGPPGADGLLGTSIDLHGVNIPVSNDVLYNFADLGVEVLESDAVLVYRSEQTQSDPSGAIYIWKLLPQTIYFNNGTELVYNFDHTFNDVRIFVDGTADLGAVDENEFFNNQDFRIVILPSSYAYNAKTDISTYSNLMHSLNVEGLQLNSVQPTE